MKCGLAREVAFRAQRGHATVGLDTWSPHLDVTLIERPQSHIDAYTTNVYSIPMPDITTVPEFDGFDWSGGNAEKNWERHQVTPLEAEQVFFNTPVLAGADVDHSQREKRFYALGQTDEGRELFVAFTLRAKRLRVVSVRDMSRKERRVYRS